MQLLQHSLRKAKIDFYGCMEPVSLSFPPEGQALHVIDATPSRVCRKMPFRSWGMICFYWFVSSRTWHTIQWHRKRSIMFLFQHQSSNCHKLNCDYPIITFHFNTSKTRQASSYMPNWEKHLPFSGSQSDHFASLARIQRHATSKSESCVLTWSLKISSTVSKLIESLVMNSSTSGAKAFKSRLTCFSMEISRLAVFRLPLAHSSGLCSGNTTRLGVSLSHFRWNGQFDAFWTNHTCNTARGLTCQGAPKHDLHLSSSETHIFNHTRYT